MSDLAISRIRGGIEGLLIGDAFGVPYEFHAPHTLPSSADLDFEAPAGFDRAHRGIAAGTWSDDGAQALCLLESLLESGALSVSDLAERFVRWYQDGHLAVDGVVFDVGIGTRIALHAIAQGTDPLRAARTDVNANGNGALMRVLPLALWHQGTDRELVDAAHLQTRITHGHERAQVCSALYCLWARRELIGRENAYEDAVVALREIYADAAAMLHELDKEVRPDAPPQGNGSGYVVDCLHSARLALLANDYEGVVRAAVSLGHDTDTTAAVAAGLAGVRFGIEGIPERWRAMLRGRSLCDPLVERLLTLRPDG